VARLLVEWRQREARAPRPLPPDDVLLRPDMGELAPRAPRGGALSQLGRTGASVVEHPLGADEVGAELGHLVRVRGTGKGRGYDEVGAELGHVVGPVLEVGWMARDEERVGGAHLVRVRSRVRVRVRVGVRIGSRGVLASVRVRVRCGIRREWPLLTTPLRRRAASRKTSLRSSGFVVGPSLCSGLEAGEGCCGGYGEG